MSELEKQNEEDTKRNKLGTWTRPQEKDYKRKQDTMKIPQVRVGEKGAGDHKEDKKVKSF